jgi:hypothetical protein
LDEQPQGISPIALFPPEMQAGVADLAHLGFKQRTVNFCGHTFVLEMLRPYLKHAISLVMEPFRNTVYQPQIWAACHVAVALISVNGDTAFCPQTQDSITGFVEARYRWLSGPEGYYDPTIDYLMGQLTEMDLEVQTEIAELHRLSDRSRDTSQPSPDSSTEPGLFAGLTGGDTQPSESSS